MSELIDPRSLRIGNLLEYKGEVWYVTMLSLDIDDEYQDLIGITKAGETTGEVMDWNRVLVLDLKPLELNSTLLRRLGFAENDSPKRSDAFYNIALGGSGLFINPDNGVVWIESPSGKHFFNVPLSIDYCHQLQNLYFGLTGQELEYEKTVSKSRASATDQD